MARKYGRKRRYSKRKYGKGKRSSRSMRRRGNRTARTARRALQLAKRIANHSEETKYFGRGVTADLINNGAGGKCAVFDELTEIKLTDTALFYENLGTAKQPIIGNKYYHRKCVVRWEVHMDNTNNEEETVNFTVAVVKMKRDADRSIQSYGFPQCIGNHTSVFNGQALFDMRYVKVLYYKYFTRTMGGTSPGTAGESTRYGKFCIPINKMMRRAGAVIENYSAYPVDNQDRYFFVVFTDNTSTDTENPRINYSIMNVVKDTDVFDPNAG